MKKATIMAFLLAALAPLTQVWGHSTHYGKIEVVTQTGEGTVYVSTSGSATSGSTYATWDCGGSSSSDSKSFYIYATPANDDWEFQGWTDGSASGTPGNATSPRQVTPSKAASENSGSPTTTKYYAHFKSTAVDPYSITFVPGNYTVDGSAPSDMTGLKKVKEVVLASSDEAFLNWVINGENVVGNPYTVRCEIDTTISAEFLTADQVKSVSSISNLTEALSNAAYRKIIIPSDATLTVAKGSTVTVPAGKQLVVDGTLNVIGTVSNSGVISGSGKLYKISYLIDQGDVITVYTADGKECGAMTCACQDSKMPRYCKTTVTQNSPSVNGTVSCTTSWGVLLNGTAAYAISKQSPKAVKVSLDTTKDSNGKQSVVNKITAITADTDSVNEDANYVLFADMKMTGPIDSSSSTLRSTATVDCAGRQLSADTKSHSSFGISVLNGSFVSSAGQWQNAHAAFFGMSSVTIGKVKGVSSTYFFYDCGTKSSPCSVSYTYYNNTRTDNYRTQSFYSGYYKTSFSTTDDGSGKSKVYGGSYTADPSSYIPTTYDGVLQAQYDGSKYYDVTDYKPPAYVCAVGGKEYESLEDAVSAAKNGDVISLSAAIELTGTVTIPSGKSVTLSLENHVVTGGKIVNNGTLLITDSSTGKGTTATDASGGILKSDIENNGTLDFIFGTYEGSVVNKAGTLTAHNGLFKGSFTKEGGTVNLKGGHFSADVEDLATVENTKVFFENGLYSVCELPNGTMHETVVSSANGYGATPYTDADYDLIAGWFNNKSQRTTYSSANWERIAELICFYQLFNNRGLDATLKFDRYVAADSLTLYAASTVGTSVKQKDALEAGELYRALSAVLNGNGYASKTYKALWQDNLKTVAMAVTDKSGNNAGTVCTAMVELWKEDRAADYSSTGHKLTNTVFIAAEKRFTIGAGSNVAMIRPEIGAATFYETVDAAVDAVEEGGTVMLANDCSGNVTVGKACTIDTNGFAFTGNVAADEDYEIDASADGVYVVTAKVIDPVAKVDVETVVAQVVSDEWLEANEISTENKTPEEIRAAVQEVLSEPDDNGNAKWENLVLGQDSETKPAIEASTGGTETTAMIEVSFEVPKDETTGEAIDTGYTVKYAFDEVDATTGDVIERGEAEATPSLDLEKVTSNEASYFTMRAVLESNDGKTTSEVEVEKTIGVMKVESSAEYTILAVPWKSLGDGDVKASELVHAASLQDGDQLIVYGKNGTPNKWTVRDGEWVSEKRYDMDEDEPEASAPIDPSTVGLERGQGVWLKRTDPENSPIYLIGQPSDEDDVETALAEATVEGVDGEQSWNLVASPSVEPIDVTDVLETSGATADRVIIPMGSNAVPKNFHYNARKGKWGYDSTEIVYADDGVTPVGVRAVFKTDDAKLPAGTGFWYLNSSKDSSKTIKW